MLMLEVWFGGTQVPNLASVIASQARLPSWTALPNPMRLTHDTWGPKRGSSRADPWGPKRSLRRVDLKAGPKELLLEVPKHREVKARHGRMCQMRRAMLVVASSLLCCCDKMQENS